MSVLLHDTPPDISRPRECRRRAFTLIELLIVVTIIGLLVLLAIPKFGNTKDRTYTAAMKSDLRNLRVGQELFMNRAGRYAAFDIAWDVTPDAATAALLDSVQVRPSSYVSISADTIQPTALHGWGWTGEAIHSLISPQVRCLIGADVPGARPEIRCEITATGVPVP